MKVVIFLILGILIMLLERLNKAMGRADFSWGKFFQKNGVPAALNLVAGCILIFGLNMDQQAFVFNGKDWTFLVAAMMGVTGHVIITGIFNLLSKKISTGIGINQ